MKRKMCFCPLKNVVATSTSRCKLDHTNQLNFDPLVHMHISTFVCIVIDDDEPTLF